MALGIAILGTGSIATRAFAPAVHAVDGASLTAVLSRDPARGEAFAQQFGIPEVYDNLEALLQSPQVNASLAPASEGGAQQARFQGGVNERHAGDPSFDTSDFGDEAPSPGNLRLDYVLPSADLTIVEAGIFWPTSDDPLFELVSVSEMLGARFDLTEVFHPTTEESLKRKLRKRLMSIATVLGLADRPEQVASSSLTREYICRPLHKS